MLYYKLISQKIYNSVKPQSIVYITSFFLDRNERNIISTAGTNELLMKYE